MEEPLIGLSVVEYLRMSGFTLKNCPIGYTHVCGLNEFEELQKIGDCKLLSADTLQRKRLVQDHLVTNLLADTEGSLGDVVICKSAFDAQQPHLIESLMSRELTKLVIVPSQICTIARSGKTDGVVIELSESGASSCAIYDGTIVKGTYVKNHKIGAKRVTDNLVQQLWLNKGYSIPTGFAYLVGDYIKRRYGFVQFGSLFEKLEHLKAHTNCLLINTQIQLPDGNNILIDTERYTPYECLFKSERNLLFMLAETISVLDTWGRADMKDRIIISGGLKDTPGLLQRVQQIPIPILKTSTMTLSAELTEGAVQGGLIIGSFLESTRKDLWVTKSDCEEQGYGRIANLTFGFV